MEIDHQGFVKHTDIVESIIESKHRGIYEEIATHENSI
jgi:exoribonuclease R